MLIFCASGGTITGMDTEEKKAFYEDATKNLLAQLNTMDLLPDDKQKAIYYTKLFREAFKYNEIKQYAFISPESDIWDLGYDSAGFCRISSTVFSIVLGFQNWKLMRIEPNVWKGNASHHYLQHVPSGKFFDITYDQFAIDGCTVPYKLGVPAMYRLYPNNDIMRFAKALDIDIIGMLKQTPKRQ